MSPALRRWVVLAAALLGALVTARLGMWQLARAAQKEALQAQLESRAAAPSLDGIALAVDAPAAEAQHYRHVRVRGRWVSARTVYLDNRQMHGRPGFYVVTPLLIDGAADAVLVQRGWVPRDAADRTRVPRLADPEGLVQIEGLVAPPPGRLYALGADSPGAIRQNLDLEAFARETGLRLRPLSVLQLDPPGAAPSDALQRDWPPPAFDVQKHYGYAFQWFAMASLITGLYVWFQLIRPRLQRRT